ncbi:biotin synthase BioB [Ferroacidibacillus organovorans]|uniref:Biotin synthase n=1 Tax=Ferroacidibacillus organovorans TaxID=1765683 RepID=A0A853KBX6_9BACL|nr:biotin synthase BioB [Ferroacidibacillus organovorans]KYP82027.1 biotin synthase BioB [Ferroacidibacillus organovorans]OAG94347.1 biotin synthase [Ferroacidibacillus organovorans]
MSIQEMTRNFHSLAKQVVAGKAIGKEEALTLLQTPDAQLLELLSAAYEIRRHHFGNKVKLNMIINAKSGMCPEDCGYCSQSIVSSAPVEKYSLLDREQILNGAKEAARRKAGTYCIVMSGRRPSKREVNEVADAVREITSHTQLKICCCMGLITQEDADTLADAGVHRFNHNLNTSEGHYDRICSTHAYEDRVDTIEHVKTAGMSPCSGIIVGMGETEEDVVDVAFELQDLDVDSIPVNFLNPIDGTPLEGMRVLDPRYCLKVLAMFRFVNPTKEIRVSGGREINLRSLQPLSLYAANSIFVGDYLTTGGQEPVADWKMIEDLGFEIEECAL